ncbi:unnamed protein product [Parnassius mnemosyne]|uniref:Uncharacterized protein n=1 Tax=Parnassius mnemosyne TaxID=213953 RepID=A0AAV1LB16_9NEOP
MAALDGIPFSVFCTFEDLRRLFTNSGYNKLPKTPKGIKNIVINYSKQEKKKLVTELKNLLALGKKFSLSFDEWISSCNARYMNINIHIGVEFTDDSRFKNLGLVRMDGSMPSETCIRLLKEKLSEFELSLDRDTVAIVTDDASKQGGAENVRFSDTAVTAGGSESDSEFENDADSAEYETGGFEVIPVVSNSNPNELNNYYKSVISKVRAVVKIFKNSPVKNDMFLQKHVKQDTGKELQLLADCKTRSGSISTMVDRFNRLRSCVSKALIDMNSDIKFTQSEFHTLDNFQKSLNIIKVTVEALCRQNYENEHVVRVMDDLALDNSASSVSGDFESVDFAKELNKEIEKSLKEKNTNMRNRNETEDEANIS